MPIAIAVKWLRKNGKITKILKTVELNLWIIKYLKKYYNLLILAVDLPHKDINLKNKMNGRVIKMDKIGVILASLFLKTNCQRLKTLNYRDHYVNKWLP